MRYMIRINTHGYIRDGVYTPYEIHSIETNDQAKVLRVYFQEKEKIRTMFEKGDLDQIEEKIEISQIEHADMLFEFKEELYPTVYVNGVEVPTQYVEMAMKHNCSLGNVLVAKKYGFSIHDVQKHNIHEAQAERYAEYMKENPNMTIEHCILLDRLGQ